MTRASIRSYRVNGPARTCVLLPLSGTLMLLGAILGIGVSGRPVLGALGGLAIGIVVAWLAALCLRTVGAGRVGAVRGAAVRRYETLRATTRDDGTPPVPVREIFNVQDPGFERCGWRNDSPRETVWGVITERFTSGHNDTEVCAYVGSSGEQELLCFGDPRHYVPGAVIVVTLSDSSALPLRIQIEEVIPLGAAPLS